MGKILSVVKGQNDSENVPTMQLPTTQQLMMTSVTVEGTLGDTNTRDIETIPENPSE